MSSVLKSPATAPPTVTTATSGMTRWLALVLVVVLFAGGLFAYDQGVISGALPGIKSAFSLSELMVQVLAGDTSEPPTFAATLQAAADRIEQAVRR